MIPSGDNRVPDERRWLLCACLVAAATHAFSYAFYPQDIPRSPDEKEYLALGVQLAQSGELCLPSGEVAKRMPLYPVFIAGVHKWQRTDAWQNAILLLQTFLAWCTVLLIALTAERLADGRAALLAALIAALYSPYRLLQMSFLTETLLIFLLSLAVFIYVIAGIRHGSAVIRSTALLGVSAAIGLAVLARANALLFIVPFALDTVLRAGSPRWRVARVAMILLPVAACAAMWCWRNEDRVGRFTLSTVGGLNFYLGHNPGYSESPDLAHADYQIFRRLQTEEGLSEVQADQRLFADGLNFIAKNPGQTFVNTAYKLVVWLTPAVTLSAPTTVVLALGFLAFHGLRRERKKPATGVRRFLFLFSLTAFIPALVLWFIVLFTTFQPWTTPQAVLPLGLIALVLLRTEPNVRGLLAGLFVSQLLVALVFIPLVRLRWTVDGVLIIALAVGLSHLCRWLSGESDGAGEPS